MRRRRGPLLPLHLCIYLLVVCAWSHLTTATTLIRSQSLSTNPQVHPRPQTPLENQLLTCIPRGNRTFPRLHFLVCTRARPCHIALRLSLPSHSSNSPPRPRHSVHAALKLIPLLAPRLSESENTTLRVAVAPPHPLRLRRLQVPPGLFLVRLDTFAHHRSCDAHLSYSLIRQSFPCPLVLPERLNPVVGAQDNDTSRANPPPPVGNDPSTAASASTQVSPRVVGGSIPHESLQSHTVAFVAGRSFVCSGSVIAARWAITAAHCKINPDMIATVGGSTVVSGTLMAIRAVFRHPEYDTGRTDSPNDIALVLFEDDVPSDTVFIRVNTNATVPEPGAYARVAGYGQVFESSASAQTLRQVDIPVVSMGKCKADYSRADFGLASRLDPTLQLCAGLDDGGCDACQGDSGGPLALFDSLGFLVQIGIVSFGIGCARADFPGVYTRLSNFEGFLREVGAEYTRSSDGVTVFSSGSEEATGDFGTDGFSLAGLPMWQSILVVCGIALVAAIVAFLSLFVLVRSVRSRSGNAPTPTAPPDPTDYHGTTYPPVDPLAPGSSDYPPFPGAYSGVQPPSEHLEEVQQAQVFEAEQGHVTHATSFTSPGRTYDYGVGHEQGLTPAGYPAPPAAVASGSERAANAGTDVTAIDIGMSAATKSDIASRTSPAADDKPHSSLYPTNTYLYL